MCKTVNILIYFHLGSLLSNCPSARVHLTLSRIGGWTWHTFSCRARNWRRVAPPLRSRELSHAERFLLGCYWDKAAPGVQNKHRGSERPRAQAARLHLGPGQGSRPGTVDFLCSRHGSQSRSLRLSVPDGVQGPKLASRRFGSSTAGWTSHAIHRVHQSRSSSCKWKEFGS